METSSCPAVARQKTRSEFEKNGDVMDEKKISEVSEGSEATSSNDLKG